ncbi:MAG: type II toxin-antitoxin system death-on-curing family toxin [Faecalibacterium sp.]|nr:type II toxin-antitoxin system death-on-curing family toxin [Ruminococcus sp.]MCM1391283.1 type II toxin-antitoxin system death-on-curing family toxin [Ruminococcus sp.]MCM1484743.1 type II toxin-antitoxin system death-on-curing family toxin [Faecalibacterium sp.]
MDLHHELILSTGGTDGLRDDGLLESALSTPFQNFGGTDMYPSIQQKAARLGFGLIKNHAFIDGNKRIGAHIMLVFLFLNGIELDYTQQELIDMVLGVAAGSLDFKDMTKWIISHQI